MPSESDARTLTECLLGLGFDGEAERLARDWNWLSDYRLGPWFDEWLVSKVAASPEKRERLQGFYGDFPSPEEYASTKDDRITKKAMADNLARALAAQLDQLFRTFCPGVASAPFGLDAHVSSEDATAAWQDDDTGGPQDEDEPVGMTLAELPILASAPDLARHYNLNGDRVETALRRYRANHRDCFVEVENRRKNEPQFLYRTAEVRPILDAMTDG
jgi:hypothetical protein